MMGQRFRKPATEASSGDTNQQAKIYALLDPSTRAVRYIGKTIQRLERRLHLHLNERGKLHKHRWLALLARQGLRPLIVELETVALGDDWRAAESKWIKFHKDAGANLVNHTSGGEGLHNPSQETRAKCRAARLAWENDPLRRAKFTASLANPERGRKISQALKGKSHTPEHVAKLPQNKPGGNLSEEHRDKISRSLLGNKRALGFKHSEETKRKVSDSKIGNKNTLGRVMPEHERVARSVAVKGRPKSKEHIEKIRAGLTEYWRRRRMEKTNDTLF